MKHSRIKRSLALMLTLVLLLGLLPMQALAGGDFLEFMCYDLERGDNYTMPDGYLLIGSDGAVRTSVSGGKSLSGDVTISAVWLVDADTSAEVYNLLDPSYGGTNESQVRPWTNSETNAMEYGLDVWIHELTIPNAKPGEYRLKVVTSAGTYISEAYDDGYIQSDGIVRIVSSIDEIPNSFAVTTLDLPRGTVGEFYSQTLTATKPATWEITSGSLPAGLTLDGTTGVISGTPTQSGSSIFKATASTNTGETNYQTLEIIVDRPPEATVQFYLNGGWAQDLSPYLTQTILSGETITLPPGPNMYGGVFTGWESGKGAVYQSGAVLTITADTYFIAQYRELEPTLVRIPDGLPAVVGSVWLTCQRGDQTITLSSSYYSEVTTLTELTIPSYQLTDGICTDLELHANVDGVDTVLARRGGEVPVAGTVTLTLKDVDYVPIAALAVQGMTQGTDYYFDVSVEGKYVYFPLLVSPDRTFQIRLQGNSRSAQYGEYDWDAVYKAQAREAANGLLRVTPRALMDRVKVSGVVRWKDGTPANGISVLASETISGMTHTFRAYSDANGAYTLWLYPGGEATLSCSQWNGQVLLLPPEPTLTVTETGGHDLTITTVSIQTEVSLSQDLDGQLLRRYLGAVSDKELDLYISEPSNYERHTIRITGQTVSDTLQLYKVEASGEVTCSASGAIFRDIASVDVTLDQGSGTLTLTPTLRPGVVVKLSSPITGSYRIAWYDAQGDRISLTEDFYLIPWAWDIAFVCPDDAATAVLLSNAYAQALDPSQKLSALPQSVRLGQWTVSPQDNQIEDLGEWEAPQSASENTQFITQPGSTLQAGAENFSSVTELIPFTGSIGLAEGLLSVTLDTLTVDTGSYTEWYVQTAVLQAIVINGEYYAAEDFAAPDHCVYYLDFSDKNVTLPCNFTLYFRPGQMHLDMDVSVSAKFHLPSGVYTSDQLIGSATVARPGASLSTLSTNVCSDTVTLRGTALPGESVSIYDNGIAAGSATADRTGLWVASVPLVGIDTTGGQLTTHQFQAISASGVRSERLLVLHRTGGPELTSLTMIWDGQTINVGDAYSFGGSMDGVSFTATFANIDELDELIGWDGAKVVFKVFTADGGILFLTGTREGNTYTAKIPTELRCSVIRAEAIYRAKEGSVGIAADAETGETDFTPNSAQEKLAQSVLEACAQEAENFEALRAMTPANNFSIDFTRDSPTVTGSLPVDAETSSEAALAGLREAQQLCQEAGVSLKSYQVSYDDTETILEWLNDIADARLDSISEHNSSYGRTCMLSDKASYDGAMAAVAGYAQSHDHLSFDSGIVYDRFILSDVTQDEDTGEANGGTYFVVVEFFSGKVTDANQVYMVSGSALLGHDFAGYQEAALQGADEAVLLRYESFHGNYQQSNSYTADCETETGTGAIATELGVGSGYLSSIPQGMGTAAGNVTGYLGVAGTVVNEYYTLKNNHTRFTSSMDMKYDLQRLMNSPCFQKIKSDTKAQGKVQLIEEAQKRFEKKMKKMQGTDNFVAIVSTAGNLTGMVLTFIPGTQGAGVIVSGATGLFSFCGGMVVGKQYEDVIQSYNQEYNTIRRIFRSYGMQNNIDDCKEGEDGDGQNNRVSNDPSGIVYEGVIENPVQGATVTLYYAVDAQGKLVQEKTDVAQLVPAWGVENQIPADATQVTGEDGRFQWGVPEGLWFVTAEYAGLTGNSQEDAEATVSVSDLSLNGQSVSSLLPVLPVQLDVNIPLVDYTPPTVSNVEYTAEGVYVTFSKYMDEDYVSVLNRSYYTLEAFTGERSVYLPISKVVPIDQGHAPANIDSQETTYTRTVLLKTEEPIPAGTDVRLTVNDLLRSYAGTSMGQTYTASGTVLMDVQLDKGSDTATLTYHTAPAALLDETRVVVAWYDESGQMLDCRLMAAEDVDTVIVPLAATHKVFLVSGAFAPLCPAWVDQAA